MTANQIQLYCKTSTDPISKHRNLSLGAHTGPPEVSGEGLTVPERVGPRGADNAASLVLACLPCAQAVNPYGRHPLTKKSYVIMIIYVTCSFLPRDGSERTSVTTASHFYFVLHFISWSLHVVSQTRRWVTSALQP